MSLVLCAVAMLVHLLLAGLVLHRAPRKTVNQVFAVLLMLFFLWDLAELLILLCGPHPHLVRLLFTPVATLPYGLALFIALFPRPVGGAPILDTQRRGLALFAPVLVLLGLIWTGRLPETVITMTGALGVTLGAWSSVGKGIVVGYLALALYTLSRANASPKTGLQEQRLKYVIAGLVLPAAAGGVLLALARWFLGGDAGLTVYPYGVFPFLGLMMAGLIGYAILKYNLLGVDALISIGVVYTLLTAMLAGIMELVENGMQSVLELPGLVATIVSTLAIAATFSPIKNAIQRFVDHRFGRKPFDPSEVLRNVVADMRAAEAPPAVLARALAGARSILEFGGAAIVLTDGRTARYPDDASAPELPTGFTVLDPWPPFDDIEALAEALETEGRAEAAAWFNAAVTAGFRHVLPLRDRGTIVGAWFMTPKGGRLPYPPAELSLAAALADEIAPTLRGLHLVGQLIEKDRDLQELAWTRRLYQQMQPPGNLDRVADLPARFHSALSPTIKGDLLDIWQPAPDRALCTLNDAFGQGLPAALTLHLVRACVRTLGPEAPLVTHLDAIARSLREARDEGLGVALTLVGIAAAPAGATAAPRVRLVNAGNPAPWWWHGGRAERIGVAGKPLGAKPDVKTRADDGLAPLATAGAGNTETTLAISAYDVLLITTNGLLSAIAPDRREETGDRLVGEILAQHAPDGPTACHQALLAAVATNLGNQAHDDDITFLLLAGPPPA